MTVSIKTLLDKPLGNDLLEEYFGVTNLMKLEVIFLQVIGFNIFITSREFEQRNGYFKA